MAGNDNSELRLSSEYYVRARLPESSIVLSKTDERRLRNLINQIDDKPNWWEIAAGIFFSAAVSLVIAIYQLPDGTPTQVQLIRQRFIMAAVASAGLGLLCLCGLRTKKNNSAKSKKDVLDELELIESQYSTVSQEQETGQAELQILRAEYGADDTWIDVTEKVRLNGEQHTVVTNEFIGQDPLSGVVKVLRVRYSKAGEQFDKEFKEGTPIELPF